MSAFPSNDYSIPIATYDYVTEIVAHGCGCFDYNMICITSGA